MLSISVFDNFFLKLLQYQIHHADKRNQLQSIQALHEQTYCVWFVNIVYGTILNNIFYYLKEISVHTIRLRGMHIFSYTHFASIPQTTNKTI